MTKRIVCVDDALFIRAQLKRFFEQEMQFTVVAMGASGIEAVELYKEHRPDLVTLDVTMPRKSGIEALREILALDGNARVVMCSAINNTTKIVEAMNYGARAYIEKPFDFNDPAYVMRMKETICDALQDGGGGRDEKSNTA